MPLHHILRALLGLVFLSAAPLAAGQGTFEPSERSGGSPAPDAYVIRIEGSLNAGHQALFQRAVRRARADGAVLVMAFDTPGGELTRMRQFAAAVDTEVDAGLPIVGFVDDQALSAGTWIAIATRSLYMRTRATMGAATAIQITPRGVEPAAEKFASAYRAWVRAWADEHGRDPLLSQAMIDMDTAVRVRVDGVEELISSRSGTTSTRGVRRPSGSRRSCRHGATTVTGAGRSSTDSGRARRDRGGRPRQGGLAGATGRDRVLPLRGGLPPGTRLLPLPRPVPRPAELKVPASGSRGSSASPRSR